MKEIQQKLLELLRASLKVFLNRYAIAFIIALVWVTFFDQFNLRSQYKMRQKVKRLEKEISYYQKAIADAQSEQKALESNEEALERLARERYLMKKDNEDLYIIIDPNKAKINNQ